MPVFAPTYRMVVNVPRTRATRDPGMFLGADPAAPPPTIQSAIQQALQVATPIVQQRLTPNQPIPTSITNYLTAPSQSDAPAPKRTWLPWAVGGGTLVLGAVLLLALRRRK